MTDLRDSPLYSLPEAAHYLALPASTVRTWTVGMKYRRPDGTQATMRPLIMPAVRRPLTLSFFNLVELFVLASMRRAHNVSMPRVRKALLHVERELGRKRPLLEESFLTDGVDLFIEEYSELVNVSQNGQRALRALLEGALKRIERDEHGLALRLYPWLNEPDESRDLEIDPARAFGRMVVAGTGVPSSAIAERWRAGERIDALARDYGISAERIEAALRWEQCALAA